MRGSGLDGWLTPYPFQACTRWCSMQKHLLKPVGSHMDRLMLDHFQWLAVVLYDNRPAVDVGVEFLQTEAY